MSWHQAYLESRVLAADPLDLISLLYQGALDAVHDARKHLADGDIAARSRAISRTSDIVTELDVSLNHAIGGSISRGLAELYQYIKMRLLEANFRQDDKILAEVQSLLVTLGEAWKAIHRATEANNPGAPNLATGQFPTEVWGEAAQGDRLQGLAGHSWNA